MTFFDWSKFYFWIYVVISKISKSSGRGVFICLEENDINKSCFPIWVASFKAITHIHCRLVSPLSMFLRTSLKEDTSLKGNCLITVLSQFETKSWSLYLSGMYVCVSVCLSVCLMKKWKSPSNQKMSLIKVVWDVQRSLYERDLDVQTKLEDKNTIKTINKIIDLKAPIWKNVININCLELSEEYTLIRYMTTRPRTRTCSNP